VTRESGRTASLAVFSRPMRFASGATSYLRPERRYPLIDLLHRVILNAHLFDLVQFILKSGLCAPPHL
jgi:hypothetical protein